LLLNTTEDFICLTKQLEAVRAELQLSREIFVKKTAEQSRHLAWVSAAIISAVSWTGLYLAHSTRHLY